MSQIARTIAKVLHLHEELTEAIALGHDLGHTPFGHAGERVLSDLMPGGFNHYEQSLRVVDVLENDRRGLNLTWEVRDGIAKHSKGKRGAPVGADPGQRSATLEGQIARVADLIAYVNHDIDDAIRAGLMKESDLPAPAVAVVGHSSSERIGRMVSDVVGPRSRAGFGEIQMSPDVLEAMLTLREFLFGAVYENDASTAEFQKAHGILGGLWEKVRAAPGRVSGRPDPGAGGQGRRPSRFHRRHDRPVRRGPVRAVVHPPPVGCQGDAITPRPGGPSLRRGRGPLRPKAAFPRSAMLDLWVGLNRKTRAMGTCSL